MKTRVLTKTFPCNKVICTTQSLPTRIISLLAYIKRCTTPFKGQTVSVAY
uniref:Uncharacterized protein n=1 Tax=Anguilla anguilla TaxID=7936 RepID=A0A0E9RGY8_ANGAN